jgi:hypothetical protein
MKKKTILIVVIISGLIIATIFFYYFTQIQENEIKKLEAKIEFLKEETTPVRFKILSKEDSLIHFALKFYDTDNNEIIRKEFRLQGDQLSFDFIELPLKDRYIAFPYKIFTDKIAPEDGILLYDLYDVNGFPQIFYSSDIDTDLKDGLLYLFELLKSGKTDELDGIFGNMVQDVKKYNEFIERQIYKIVIHTKGGIEIIPD